MSEFNQLVEKFVKELDVIDSEQELEDVYISAQTAATNFDDWSSKSNDTLALKEAYDIEKRKFEK